VVSILAKCITAPYVLDGTLNGKNSRVYIEQIFVPTLNPSDIAAMDSVPAIGSPAFVKLV
jgi:hypothetical protein